MRERSPYITPKDFHPLGLPLGRLIPRVTTLSPDQGTREAVPAIRETLEKKGVVFLDWHNSPLDTVVIAAHLFTNLDLQTCIVPVAASHYTKGWMKFFLTRMGKIPGIEMHPVYRDEEKADTEKLLARYGLTPEEVEAATQTYTDRQHEVLPNPHTASVIAPWGTRKKDTSRSIRKGVYELLAQGYPAVCTYATSQKSPKPLVAQFSDRLLEFDESVTREQMSEVIRTEFETLQQRPSS